MPTADEDRIALRRAKALQLRIRGYTVREIGLELGVSKSVAAEDVRHAMGEAKKLSEDELQAERDLELHRIDAALRVVAKILNGRAVTVAEAEASGISDADETELLDAADELKLKAVDRQVRLQEQRAKLLGLYAPAKVETEVKGVSLDDIDLLRAAVGANGCNPPTNEPPPSIGSGHNS